MASRSVTLEKKAAPARQPSDTATIAASVPKVAAAVTLKGVFERLAEGHDLPKKQAQALLDGMIEAVTIHLKHGDR